MSQRGGSVMTHLKIGISTVPLVKKGSADILLSLEKTEAYKTLYYLKPFRMVAMAPLFIMP